MKNLIILVIFISSLFLPAQNIFINEFMADNESTIEDPDEPGIYEDWIELYNEGTFEVDLEGFYLTDDLDELTKWQIPENITISSHGFLLFWADNDEDQGNFHTNFKLSANGEDIAIIHPDGETILDSYTFGEQATDISEGRFPDGNSNWEFMPDPTPGYANISSNLPPEIDDFNQIPLAPSSQTNVNVTALITDDETIATAFIKYDTGTGNQNITMYDDGQHGDSGANDNIFGGYIPQLPSGTSVNYYLEATDDMSAVSTYPENAPDLTFQYVVDYDPPQIFINEFMADNESFITDPQEEYEDWIEIYNASEEPIDIGGLYFTDNFSNPTDWWKIPESYPDSTTIQPGNFLLLWADNDSEDGILHLEFKLAGAGEEIGLFAFYGTTPIDTLTFGLQTTDISFGRFPDGSENWIFMNYPSPGSSNLSNSIDENEINFTAPIILHGNYPNPFRDITSIRFSLKKENNVCLEIFNLKGQKIRTLLDEILAAGEYSFFWKRKDNEQSPVCSGIYFYKISTSEQKIMKKMTLLK